MERNKEIILQTFVLSIPSEAQRLMAALLKFNDNTEDVRAVIAAGGLKPVVCLLSSEHVLMQNEGLVGLIIATGAFLSSFFLLSEFTFLHYFGAFLIVFHLFPGEQENRVCKSIIFIAFLVFSTPILVSCLL